MNDAAFPGVGSWGIAAMADGFNIDALIRFLIKETVAETVALLARDRAAMPVKWRLFSVEEAAVYMGVTPDWERVRLQPTSPQFTGRCWPGDRTQCALGDILFLTAEDDVADTLRPRLEASGANLRRTHIIEGAIAGYKANGTREDRMFSLAADIRALGQKLDELGGVAAVVIDPITAYLGGVDSHKNADVRAILAPLGEVASRHYVAIIGISHLTKAAGSRALMRVNGYLAFVAAARAAYLITPDQNDKGRRLFLPMKNNLGPDATGLAFRIEVVTVPSAAGPLETTRVAWELEPVTITADEGMQTPEPTKDDSKLNQATGWLHLGAGGWSSFGSPNFRHG